MPQHEPGIIRNPACCLLCRLRHNRHTTVTRLLERGVPFAVAATVLDWSAATSVRMAKRYGHIGPSAQREAMARLDQTAV